MLPPHPIQTSRRALRVLYRPSTPILVQLVVTRRCNLACGYCNEYDAESDPVPLGDLRQRIDAIAALGTLAVTVTGGEPLLHPRLAEVVKHVTGHGMVCTAISNAYGLTRQRIEQLNAAGLSLMQISIDNLYPTPMSRKSWTKLEPRLLALRRFARFRVNVNATLGASSAEETRALVQKVRAMGFYMTVGLLHDASGQIDAGLVGDELPAFYEEMRVLCRKSPLHALGEGWEGTMLREGHAPYQCRAGARYLYVDEHGTVALCSQRRAEPGIPILRYSKNDLRRSFSQTKGCETGCTLGCVRRASSLDEWR